MMQEKFIQIAMNETSTVYTTRSGNEQQFKTLLLHQHFLSGKFYFDLNLTKSGNLNMQRGFILEVSEMN